LDAIRFGNRRFNSAGGSFFHFDLPFWLGILFFFFFFFFWVGWLVGRIRECEDERKRKNVVFSEVDNEGISGFDAEC